MKDRMQDLQKQLEQSDAEFSGRTHCEVEMDDSGLERNCRSNAEEQLTEFVSEAEGLQEEINHIGSVVDCVTHLHSAILSTPENDVRTKEDLEQRMDEIKTKAFSVRVRLKAMECHLHELEALAQINSGFGERRGSVIAFRIRRTHHATLTRAFVDVMRRYNEIEVEFRENCKRRIQRQLEITGRSVNEQELEEMLVTGNSNIFTQDIATETLEAKKTLEDIEARHANIVKLERSIREMYDLFMDMSILVENQGALVDRIEDNVLKTRDFVDVASCHVRRAHLSQNRFQTKKRIFIGVSALLSVVIVVVVIYFVIKYASGSDIEPDA